MFFPTFVLGTINSVLSPVVKGCNHILQKRDKLEYEALVRNPETAYLVSNEEFDKKLEELGWSPSDMITMSVLQI